MAPPEPVGDPATERLEHRRLAEAISVLIEEYEALEAHGRRSLLIRFWHSFPDLKKRKRTISRTLVALVWRPRDKRAQT